MKTLIHLMLLLIVAIAPMKASAQQKHRRGPDAAKREALAKAQAAEIAKKLNLNDELTQRYTETFLNCQKDIWKIGGPKYHIRPEDLTEAQAKEENEGRLKSEQKFLNIRKKYYGEYSKFLTQKQILQANRLEKEMIDRMMKQAHKKHDAKRNKGQRRQK